MLDGFGGVYLKLIKMENIIHIKVVQPVKELPPTTIFASTKSCVLYLISSNFPMLTGFMLTNLFIPMTSLN